MLMCDPRKENEQYIRDGWPRFNLLTSLLESDDGWMHCQAERDGGRYEVRFMAISNHHFSDPAKRGKEGVTVVGLYHRAA